MSVRFPFFGIGDGGQVLELEPEATDKDVTDTIATLVQVHLTGSSEEQVDEFFRHSLLPLVTGLMAGMLGEEHAVRLVDELPRWIRDALSFESAKPVGPGH